MFTGIIEELGRVRAVIPNADGARIEIDATTVLDDATLGASIAVNGCCLTVVDIGEGWFAADAVVETLRRTTLGKLAAGDPVNLERPLRLADRLGGHLVQGHVDGTGSVHARDLQSDGSVRVRFDAPGHIMRYVVHKGSITVDGISLTVAALHDDGFSVAVIPHTLAVTTLGTRAVGEPVNLECDVLAKYVERLVHGAVNEAERSELAGAGERPEAAPGIPAPSERSVHGAVNEAERSELAGAGERPEAAPGIPAPSERDQETRSTT